MIMLSLPDWQISRLAMTRLFAAALALVGLSLVDPASAHRLHRSYAWAMDGPEASGCYFSRGHMFCGRYCYTEINGKRYCQPRERDAYPQGEFYIEDTVVAPGPSRRHRHTLK
jgi:hypothetical protein